jgi:hypothetical protein
MEKEEAFQALNEIDLKSLTQEDVDRITNPVLKPILQKVLDDRATGKEPPTVEHHLLYSMQL